MGSLVKEINESEFDAEVLSASTPVVVDFWAPWCGPCRLVAPEIEKLAAKHGDTVKFVKVNVDDNRDIAIRYGIMSIPTIAKFERGQVVAQVIGARGADALAKEFGLA
ncbi:MAG: thioredoxin [Anaerosomatales bacterium]|nr:thioredoxin [Coriobacteriia bacterium]MDI6692759.1 thioredoxin [Anaerosomatales bacterium]MDI6843903.1 thioredoxin [Anaerosomatales bacterium]GAV31047.1 thioredoxin 1 [Coriobacteriaceae bacterium EMTCatB1]